MATLGLDAVFAAIDRADFLTEGQRSSAGYDTPLPIGLGQTNSQPRTVRDMLALLDVQDGQTVLDVGAGSGWTTALLGYLVGPGGRVVGVELEPELAAWGAANLAPYVMKWASIRTADPAVLGVPDEGPYDRILVSAAAQAFPHELLDQLVDDGVMVVPVGGTMTRAARTGQNTGDVEVTTHGNYSFVPLRTLQD